MERIQIEKTGGFRRRHPMAVILIAAMLATGIANAANQSKLIPAWDASDESNQAHIDHSAWQDILDTYLRSHGSGINRFDYAALKASAGEQRQTGRLLWHICRDSIPGTTRAKNRKRTGSISTMP